MSGKTKVVIAAAMMLMIVASSPAVLCLEYLAQNSHTHNCCPKLGPVKTVVLACCIQPPAVTSQNVGFALDMGLVGLIGVEPLVRTNSIQSAVGPDRDISPPPRSSILRI